MKILGISAFYHDAAAALVVDGEVVAAAQEERFTRRKHDPEFPAHAVQFCVQAAGLKPAELDYIAFYDKPFVKFERLLETYLALAPHGFASFRQALPVWIKDKLFQKAGLAKSLHATLGDDSDWEKKLLFSEHHLSHAASAFYPSPFANAAVLTMDGVGEWATTSLATGNDADLKVLREIHFPHSIGLLYSAFTYYTGFKVNSGEYKVMGLAPYGTPKYVDRIREHLIDIKEDGTFRLNLEYFDYCTGLRMTSERFHQLFGAPPRGADARLTQNEMDLAASIQAITEEIVLKLAKSIARETGQKNLCLAGGVALNCVANGKLLRERTFEGLWIQPAAGDAGGALGAALASYHLFKGGKRVSRQGRDGMRGGYLGPENGIDEISSQLAEAGATFDVLGDEEIVERCAQALAAGQAVGWHQGRMEFGPRALGARSILGDARSPTMQKLLNLKVKFRESFRPFAPSVLRENVAEWFDMDADSPYMLLVADVRADRRVPMTEEQKRLFGIDQLNVVRSAIPAVTHVDYSARIQTVHEDTNPRYYKLIRRFRELTGCPVIVNTSFNVRGEPIVCTPKDSFGCFMGTDIEVLAVGNAWLEKGRQPEHLLKRYENKFELD